MQSSGPTKRPGIEFNPGRSLYGARSKGSHRANSELGGSDHNVAITYVLALGLHAVLWSCWPGPILDPPDLVRYRSGLGFGLWDFFASSSLFLLLVILNASNFIFVPVATIFLTVCKFYFASAPLRSLNSALCFPWTECQSRSHTVFYCKFSWIFLWGP